MYFYYFRETKESNGYGTIIVAKVIKYDDSWVNELRPGWLRDLHIWLDPNDLILPYWKAKGKKGKKHKNYNSIWVTTTEGMIYNRTFWLKSYDLNKAQKIVNDYYKEITEKNSRIYTKRMNSKIEILEA